MELQDCVSEDGHSLLDILVNALTACGDQIMEEDLLTFLAQNPNRVFTKEELFKKIWDMESIGDIATVTVHIKKIREKIEPDTAKPQYIETIWGVGYRFKV